MFDGYQELRAAVVQQAIKDYCSSLTRLHNDAKAFLLSEYLTLFTDLDGAMIVKALDKRLK